MLGLSKPEDDDETIGGRIPTVSPADNGGMEQNATELNAAARREQPHGGTVADIEADYEGDLVPISDEIAEILENAADKATDFGTFKAELERLASDWSPDKIAELMAVAFFSARAKGDSRFEG